MREEIVKAIMRDMAIEQMKKYMEAQNPVDEWINLNLLGDCLKLYTNTLEPKQCQK